MLVSFAAGWIESSQKRGNMFALTQSSKAKENVQDFKKPRNFFVLLIILKREEGWMGNPQPELDLRAQVLLGLTGSLMGSEALQIMNKSCKMNFLYSVGQT